MPMKIPGRRLAPWARELIDECFASRMQRISAGSTWRSYFLLGSDTGNPTTYNKVFPHIDRLASYLYSPPDVRLSIEYDHKISDAVLAQTRTAETYLSRTFHKRGIDLVFGECVIWSLVKGKAFLKQIYGHHGIDAFLVQPEMMGVYREDLSSLNQQDAFVHSTYLSSGAVKRLLTNVVDGDAKWKKIKAKSKRGSESNDESQMFKQIIIGGVQPVSTAGTTSPAGGMVNWMAGPSPVLPANVLADLYRLDEVWIQDAERDDYTTIQIIDDVIIEGDLRNVNLCGIRGHHPFTEVCPNLMDGYFWGRSEISNLFLLQDTLNNRMDGIERLMRLQENPPRGFIGFQGMNDEKWAGLNMPGGWISEDQPNAKIEDLAPKMPEKIFEDTHQIIGFFDDEAGIEPVLRGQGEPGVRAGGHAETLVRTASPRLKDRSLNVERSLEDAGDFALRLERAHVAEAFKSKPPKDPNVVAMKPGDDDEFLLSQLPDDFHVSVDSHSASPAFSEETERLAFALHRAGAISAIDLIRLTPIQHKDSLIEAAEKREAAQAALIQQHPELLSKIGGGRRKR